MIRETIIIAYDFFFPLFSLLLFSQRTVLKALRLSDICKKKQLLWTNAKTWKSNPASSIIVSTRIDHSPPEKSPYQNSPVHCYRSFAFSSCLSLHQVFVTSHFLLSCPTLQDRIEWIKRRWVKRKDASAMWEGSESVQPTTKIKARWPVEKLQLFLSNTTPMRHIHPFSHTGSFFLFATWHF